VIFLSLYHVEVSVVVFVCLSVCLFLSLLYSVFVTNKVLVAFTFDSISTR